MSTIQELVDSFHQFATERIANNPSSDSIDELFDVWRSENPTRHEYAENVAAVNASIQDFKDGDRGTIAGEHSSQLRQEYGVADK